MNGPGIKRLGASANLWQVLQLASSKSTLPGEHLEQASAVSGSREPLLGLSSPEVLWPHGIQRAPDVSCCNWTLTSPEHINSCLWMLQNADRLESEIIYDRDFDYEYFGFKVPCSCLPNFSQCSHSIVPCCLRTAQASLYIASLIRCLHCTSQPQCKMMAKSESVNPTVCAPRKCSPKKIENLASTASTYKDTPFKSDARLHMLGRCLLLSHSLIQPSSGPLLPVDTCS